MPIDIRDLPSSSFRLHTQRNLLRRAHALGAGCAALASLVTLLAACEDDAPPARPTTEPLTAEQVTAVQQAAQSSLGAGLQPNLGDVQLRWADAQLQIEIPRLDELGVPYDRVLEPARLDVFDWSAAGEPISLAFYAGVDGRPNTYALGTEIALTRATQIANP